MGRPTRFKGSNAMRAGALLLVLSGCGDSDSGPDDALPDASLATLEIAGIDLAPAFDPDTLAYGASAGFLTTEAAIVAEPSDAGATLSIDGSIVAAGDPATRELQPGVNPVEIEVVNGEERRLYTLSIDRSPFAELATLSADLPRGSTHVGTSLGAHGESVMAGTPFEDGTARGVNAVPADYLLQDSGAAYVFARDAAGSWMQQAYLKASNADAGDSFGHSVAIFGDTAVVGAPGESSAATGIDGDESDNSALSAGAAYVFVRGSDGGWSQQAYLKPSDATAGDRFGYTVAIHGNTVAVSSRRLEVGVIYLFTRDASGAWSQETAVSGEDGVSDVAFGDAIALDGDTLAVGAKWHGVSFAGAVYVFRRTSPGSWSQEDLLVASNAGADDNFGSSVALDGETLVAGAIREASAATGVDGDETSDSAPEAGAAYVFSRNGSGDWQQSAYLKASNTEPGDSFGYGVAIRDGWLAVGADNEGSGTGGVEGNQGDNTLPGSGAVYLFAQDAAGEWSQQLYAKASAPRGNVRLGRQLAFTANGLAAAAPFEDGSDATQIDSGIVHVFE